MVMMSVCFILDGCGGKKVDGYYYCEKQGNTGLLKLYVKIDGSSAELYSNKVYGQIDVGNWCMFHANAEKTEDGKDLYFLGNLAKYSPVHSKMSENGENMYLSSDDSGFATDTYTKINKKTFEDAVNDMNIIQVDSN